MDLQAVALPGRAGGGPDARSAAAPAASLNPKDSGGLDEAARTRFDRIASPIRKKAIS